MEFSEQISEIEYEEICEQAFEQVFNQTFGREYDQRFKKEFEKDFKKGFRQGYEQGFEQGQNYTLELYLKIKDMYQKGSTISELSEFSGWTEEKIKKVIP